MPLTVWTNTLFNDRAKAALETGLARRGHRLIVSPHTSASVLTAGQPDPTLGQADIALGQPDVVECLKYRNLRWVEVVTAGYTRYDTSEFKESFRARGSLFSNMSGVFADPCAQHVLAMMLALGRQLLPSYGDQLRDHRWEYLQRRYDSRLLTGETVLLLGFGAIGRRLAELLAPFGMKVYAVRRQTRSESGVHIIAEERLSAVLPTVDHIVNILPDNEATRNYVNARRLALCKPGARFYNVGRGTTVDDRALLEALASGRIGAAYLDVFATEPLPTDHPFWTQPNCFITPHTAGGRADQDEAIVAHFLANLERFEAGGDGMVDRVV